MENAAASGTRVARADIVVDDSTKRIAIIPVDDVALKRASIDEYEASLRTENFPVGTREYDVAEHDEEAAGQRLLTTQATTPGGIAYRLARLLSVMEEDEAPSEWQKTMVRAALRDALAQERARSATGT